MKQVNEGILVMAGDLSEIEAIFAEELDSADVDFCCSWNLYCNTNNGSC